ncbi:acyl-CoA thioester hydrolase/BAAT C-terminal domain-containing protein [Paenibacillus sp. FSL H7-0331]|uniref:acyl-CoA thioester hydrolase/BAAT C-terminal domain-containing protein n=1 Tax=Paenibacillus sp. FSL H7-0331 TaxID=1920421 RepID=UPI00096BDE6D|nr:acyl-CoA thioester hydrolase/BAAT C-terminal domain-containing protein [Paenibacillus sp. FSL H7-0331]OME94516.1 hypothetical protein BK127_41500 [Paenibacillus sp. FSL H7-0331]
MNKNDVQSFLIDDIEIVFKGLQSQQSTEILAYTKDDAGSIWSSSNVYKANDQGNINLGVDVPLGVEKGSVQSYFLVSMTQENKKKMPQFFTKTNTSPLVVIIQLISDGILLQEREIELHFKSNEVEEQLITSPFVGKFFKPRNKQSKQPVIVVGGSAGGFQWSEVMAAMLSTKGIPALAVAYFDYQGAYGLQDTLQDIPLEYFFSALSWLKKETGVCDKSIGIIGISKGGEVSLLLGTVYSDSIGKIVSYVPSTHVFEGIDFRRQSVKSSWSFQGTSLPFIPYPTEMNNADLRYEHERAKQNTLIEVVNQSRIRVEEINCPLLLLGAGRDGTWPSLEYVSEIANILQDNHYHHKVEVALYPNAGHVISIPNLPPTLENSSISFVEMANTNKDAWERVVAFLQHNSCS